MRTRPATVAGPHLDTCYRVTPGNSLLVHISPDGARTRHEMPSAAANAVAKADPQHTLIITTWPAGAK